jgi:hypothetical protein
VFAVILMAHASYIPNGFSWLDRGDIVEARAILPLGRLMEAISAPFGNTAFYRPLVTLMLSLDAAIYGLKAWGFHLTNVLLHLCVCAAFAWFVSRFLTVGTGAVMSGVVVAGIHPLSWLPTGAISYRADLLVVLFLFLAAGSYVEVRKRRDVSWWSGCLGVAVALSLLSKETALFWVPGLILSWEVLRRRTGLSWGNGSKVGLSVTCAALVGYILVRFAVVPDVWHREAVPMAFEEAIATRLASFAVQVGYVLSPRLAALSDATPIVGFAGPAWIGGIAILALSAGVVRGRGGQVGWLCAFFGIALAPALNLVPLPRFTSPHYGYLASFGVGMAVAVVVDRTLDQRERMSRWILVSIGVWAAVALVSTFRGGERFADDVRLFGPAVADDPRFLEGHQYLGDAALREKALNKAAGHYVAALRFRDDTIAYVDWVAVATRLAEIRIRQNRLTEAEQLLTQAEQGASGEALEQVAHDRAVVAQRLGDHERVIKLLEGRVWNRPEPLLLMARSLAAQGRPDEAVSILRHTLSMLDEKRQKHVTEMIQSIEQEGTR